MKKRKFIKAIPVLLFSPLVISGLTSCGEVIVGPVEKDPIKKTVILTTNNEFLKGGKINVTVTSKDGQIRNDYDNLEIGDLVKIEGLTIEEGYEFDSLNIYFNKVNGESEIKSLSQEELPFSFEILEAFNSVNISGSFKNKVEPEKLGTIKINQNIEHGTVSFKNHTSGTTVKLGSVIEVEAVADDGYELETLNVNGTSILDTKKFTVSEEITYIVDATFKLKENKPTEEYAIVKYKTSLTGGSLSFEGIENNSRVLVGTTVKVKVSTLPGYILDTLTVNSKDIKNTKTFDVVEANATYYVEATFTKVEEKSTIIIDDKIQNGTVTFEGIKSGSRVNVGATIKVNVSPADGFVLKTLTVNNKDIKDTEIFVVEEANITYKVSATFVRKTELKPSIVKFDTNTKNGTISFEGLTNNAEVAVGTIVKVNVSASNGYILDKLLVNNKDITSEKQFEVTEENAVYEVTAIFKEYVAPQYTPVTIKFDKVTGNADSPVGDLTTLFTGTTDKVSSIATSKCYVGNKSVRMASGSADGVMTITLSEEMAINTISLDVSKYNNDNGEIFVSLVGNTDVKTIQVSESGVNTVNFNGARATQIQIKVTQKRRVYLNAININSEGGDIVGPDTPTEETGFVTMKTIGEGVAYANIYEGKSGTEVTITAEPSKNYYIYSVTVNGVTITNRTGNNFKFNLFPDENSVVVTFKESGGSTPSDPTGNSLFASPEVKAAASRGTTLGSVESYYAGSEHLKGQALKDHLGRTCKQKNFFTYKSDFINTMKYTDESYDHPGYIELFYTGELYKQSSLTNFGGYVNREHVWPNHRGAGTEKGKPGSDMFSTRPCEKDINNNRSNFDFAYVTSKKPVRQNIKNGVNINEGNYCDNSLFEPKDEFKGDVARALFYVVTVYPEFELSAPSNTNDFYSWSATYMHGRFDDLYKWATDPTIDPVSMQEMHRNNVTDSKYQNNRNPFIDHPEYVERIYSKNFKF